MTEPAMQQIADWLKMLGMSEYAQRFADNRIDFSVLRDLTDQDLKDLGVVARPSAENAACDRRTRRGMPRAPATRRPNRCPRTLPSAAKSR